MLVLLSGVSGAGKDTIKKELIKRMENVESLPSYTTRGIRPGDDAPGITYNYVTTEEFETMIKNNEFYEYNVHHEHYYGTSRKLMGEKIKSGKIIVKDIDVNGVENLINLLKEDTKGMAEYNKFAMYFIEDCKKNSNVYNISTSKIEFEDGTVYTFSGSRDKSIYRNKVKIGKNIGYCHFLQNEITVNGVTKQLVNVHMVVEAGGHFETNIDYVLKYW